MNPRRILAKRPDLLRENEWSSVIVELARIGGWRRYHTHDSRRSPHGFPDWVLVKPPRLLFIELKSEDGRLSSDQNEWLDALNAVAAMNPLIEVHVWRPSDFDTAAETLTGRKVQRGRAA